MLELWQAHLSLTLLAFLLLPTAKLSRAGRSLLLLGLALASFIAIAGLPLAGYLHSLTDDLSITSMVALLLAVLVRLGLIAPMASRSRWQMMFCFGLLALLLYPATLGFTYFDPYRLGYSPRSLIIAIGALALLMGFWRNTACMLMLSAATLAFTLDIKTSNNYWDYLLDPFVAVYCWGALLGDAFRRIYQWRRRGVVQGVG